MHVQRHTHVLRHTRTRFTRDLNLRSLAFHGSLWLVLDDRSLWQHLLVDDSFTNCHSFGHRHSTVNATRGQEARELSPSLELRLWGVLLRQSTARHIPWRSKCRSIPQHLNSVRLTRCKLQNGMLQKLSSETRQNEIAHTLVDTSHFWERFHNTFPDYLFGQTCRQSCWFYDTCRVTGPAGEHAPECPKPDQSPL